MSSDWPVASALMAGRYRLVSLLETGGMAEIWRAEDELLDRPVAVKLPTGPQVVWREARMAARLSHPGIAAVHDYREAVRPDGAVVPFVVMELLTGESVAARVDRELVGWAEAARIGAAVADALAAAHSSGVVHRDIKPGNVMLTPNGVKILDFGISVAAGEPDDDDTGATFGTPAYVAPERLDGMPAEPATDVYGVGVLLFEMVTGDPPYPVETWEELAAARAKGPSKLPESLPADFRDVVNRCLDVDPAKRPTAARLRADLLAVALRSRPAAPDGGSAVGGSAPRDGAGSGAAGGDTSGDGTAAGSRAAGGDAARDDAAAGNAGAGGALTGGALTGGAAASRSSASGAAVGAAAGNAMAGGGAAGSAMPGDAADGDGVADGPGSRSAASARGHGVREEEEARATRVGASGSVGNLVRAAGASAERWAAVGSGPGLAVGGRNGSGRNTPADRRPGGGAQEGSPDRGVTFERAASRSRRVLGGAARSGFAFTDSDGARDWRPDGPGADGGIRRASAGPSGARRPVGARNFATGRAAAATLDMREPPRRRTVFGIGAAVVLAALAGAFAVLTWTHRDGDRDAAAPPSAAAPVLPTVTSTTPAPVASSAAPTSTRPSAKATTLTFADAVSRMRDAVKGGEASGQIRRDVAQDLLNLLGPLSNAQGSDLTGQVQALRQKIRTRVGEGGVTQARAAVLQSRLEDLDRAAGT